jgi:hypothetical protein
MSAKMAQFKTSRLFQLNMTIYSKIINIYINSGVFPTCMTKREHPEFPSPFPRR